MELVYCKRCGHHKKSEDFYIRNRKGIDGRTLYSHKRQLCRKRSSIKLWEDYLNPKVIRDFYKESAWNPMKGIEEVVSKIPEQQKLKL